MVLKIKPIKLSSNHFFSSIYIVFIIIFKSVQGRCCKLYLLNINKTCWGMDTYPVIKHGLPGWFFEGSRCPEPNEVTRMPRFSAVWNWRPFLVPHSSLFLHLNFHTRPLKIQEQPLNLLVLHVRLFFF